MAKSLKAMVRFTDDKNLKTSGEDQSRQLFLTSGTKNCINPYIKVMIFYTQLIYVKPGKENAFHEYENRVLPLLAKYDGTLLLRVRPDENSVIAAEGDIPYEIHLVSFPMRKNFEDYAADQTRKAALALKEESTVRIMLIEGTLM